MSSYDNSQDSMETFVKVIFGTIAGLMVLGVISGFISWLCGLSKEKEADQGDKETEKARELARVLAELCSYYQKQAAAAPLPVETAVDVEAVLEKQTIERLIELVLDEKPTRFSAQLLQIFTSNYSTKLGRGGYGEVFKGHFPDGRPIAVKVLDNYGIDKRIEEQFMAEVNTIGRTYHRNLVRLYGFCFEPNTKALVYEYMENGSLDKLIFENKHEIEWDKLYEIAVGAARGLEYLHHFSLKKIIHYDIKPANVLLDSNFCPKIADFGLAKLCNRDSTNITMSRVGGTPGYAAPEIWMPFPVSYKCDVYSFGVMLFEIMGRRRNFVGESQDWFPKQVWEKYDKGELEEIWENCEIEEKDREKAKTMVSVALWCVQYLPEARPSMRNVVKILEGGAEAAPPPNPFQHLVSSANEHAGIVSGSNSTTDYDEDARDDTTIMRKYGIHYATP
ncbi:hypothetical protein HRI_004719000 [Hibiscus trionum]|uniref:Protein kinase domain-containing protein n=1 Tax=Hibiscus trionum TaxID=183268 RepID=A0A9W7JCU3_HIBTR|nr:hypothetical protein HRI_004719000 [Hibiscus trionum]